MERALRVYLACQVLVVQVFCSFDTLQLMQDVSVDKIIRQHNGDKFIAKGKNCDGDTCIGLSSGTAVINSNSSNRPAPGGTCICQCHPHLPAFRDDLNICVDDIHECMLAPFSSGSITQQIPFVFLPLKGQIIHPSKEISFAGIKTPVCAVSGAKFLTENGWMELRDPIDADVPFRMFRDEGRTFLQWVGEPPLRNQMSGRLVLVHLMCREIEPASPEKNPIFSPCVAFRIVGSPVRHVNYVNEVSFSSDEEHENASSNLSTSECVAIAISSVLLGLIYVASVLLYLHLRKRKKLGGKDSGDVEEHDISREEEGVVKNNPLLGFGRHFVNMDVGICMDSAGSDTELPIEDMNQLEEISNQTTSALIHPQHRIERSFMCSKLSDLKNSDPSSTERLPEENVSIVEILEGREERPDTVKAITGTTRRKLYFNPAYFEPQLLLTPPPAAIEFLNKIREVITIAKQKMATKKFSPNLMGIPEEDGSYSVDPEHDSSHPLGTRRNSVVSLKRENSRRRASCTGCPGCEPPKLPELHSLGACGNCCTTTTESKEKSIQRWLDNIPYSREFGSESPEVPCRRRAHSERGHSPERDVFETQSVCQKRVPSIKNRPRRKRGKKPKAPSPPLPPPDMICEAMVVDREEDVKIPTITKKKMNAVISEFAMQRQENKRVVEYETDSLERGGGMGGYYTPPEYVEITPSQQPSPSMSSALPMDEEMTMRNAVINTKTISKLNAEEHDYELIVLNKDRNVSSFSKLWQKTHGYSLVSEVYVNNGYNYNSNPSTTPNSNASTLEKCHVENVPGKLLIKVEDCPDNYVPANESDYFEPDTLDRKHHHRTSLSVLKNDYYCDSLERPNQILLKSSGSFKINSTTFREATTDSNFKRNFGSLREIYEAKLRNNRRNTTTILPPFYSPPEDGRLLTLEDKHAKRQRPSVVQPDVIPPPPHDACPIYEHPKPPRKVFAGPKNEIGRSTGKMLPFKVGDLPGASEKPTTREIDEVQGLKQEDPGYLSLGGGSETEESLGDAQSESGAESVETHSVFFGDFRKNACCLAGSVDSGVGWDVRRTKLRGVNRSIDEGSSGSDSETVSYRTVVQPVNAHSILVEN